LSTSRDAVATDVEDPLVATSEETPDVRLFSGAVSSEAAQGYLPVVSGEPLTSEWRLWDSVREHCPVGESDGVSSSSNDAAAADVEDPLSAPSGDLELVILSGGAPSAPLEGSLQAGSRASLTSPEERSWGSVREH
jgi:hypothetical protein